MPAKEDPALLSLPNCNMIRDFQASLTNSPCHTQCNSECATQCDAHRGSLCHSKTTTNNAQVSPITFAAPVLPTMSSTPMQDAAIAADKIALTNRTTMPSTSRITEKTPADETTLTKSPSTTSMPSTPLQEDAMVAAETTPTKATLAVMPRTSQQHPMFEVSTSYFNAVPERYTETSNQPYMPKLLAKLSEDMPQEPVCNPINRPDASTSNDFNSLKVHRGSILTPPELDDDFQMVRVLRKTNTNAQGTSHSLPDPENDEFLPTCDPFTQCDSNVITPTQSTISEFSIPVHQNPFECLQVDDSSEFGDDEENCPHY